MKPRRVPAKPSAQHIWKRLALSPSKSLETDEGREAAEENLTPEALGLVLLDPSGPATWPTPSHSRTGLRGTGGHISTLTSPCSERGTEQGRVYPHFPERETKAQRGEARLFSLPSCGSQVGGSEGPLQGTLQAQAFPLRVKFSSPRSLLRCFPQGNRDLVSQGHSSSPYL